MQYRVKAPKNRSNYTPHTINTCGCEFCQPKVKSTRPKNRDEYYRRLEQQREYDYDYSTYGWGPCGPPDYEDDIPPGYGNG